MTGAWFDRWGQWIGVALIVIAAAILAVTLWPRPDRTIPPEILPPRVDSALVAERVAAARLDAEAQVRQHILDSLATVQAREDREEAARRQRTATISAHADTLHALARALGDTLGAAWRALETERAANAELRASLAAADSARARDSLRIAMLHAAYDTVDAQRRRVLALNGELREAVDRAAARGRCRVVGLFDCPSRTTVAVVALVGGYATAEYLNRE